MKNTQNHTLGSALEGGYKTKDGQQRTQKPEAGIDGKRRKHNSAAPGELQDCPGAATLFLGEPRDPCHVARFFRDLQAIESRATAGCSFDTANIACEI